MKNTINKVTGLQVGFTTEWVVLDNDEWRVLTTEEKALCEAEETTTLLANAKAIKAQKIRDSLNDIPPVTVGTVSYHGGYESAMKLDGAKRIAESAGMTSVVFYDIDNIGHTLTLTEAQNVVLAVGSDYQTRFGVKQARMVALEAAVSISEVEVI